MKETFLKIFTYILFVEEKRLMVPLQFKLFSRPFFLAENHHDSSFQNVKWMFHCGKGAQEERLISISMPTKNWALALSCLLPCSLSWQRMALGQVKQRQGCYTVEAAVAKRKKARKALSASSPLKHHYGCWVLYALPWCGKCSKVQQKMSANTFMKKYFIQFRKSKFSIIIQIQAIIKGKQY